MTDYGTRLICGLLLVQLAASGAGAADCSGPAVFRPDAASLVEAGYKRTVRRGNERIDYKKIDVTWQPFLMVEQAGCLDKTQLGLEIRAGAAAAWVPVEESPLELGGGRYRWSLEVVPCHDHFIRLSVGGEGGKAALELPNPVLAAAAEEIIASGFSPEPPRDLTAVAIDEKSVRVSWTASECAQSYDLSYGLVVGGVSKSRQVTADEGSSIIISGDGLEPCQVRLQ